MSETTKIDLHGIELPVARKGKGKPVLLLHGGGGPVINLPFTEKLADRFAFIEPVHPGFMGTRIPDHFDAIDDLRLLYLDLMDRLDLKDAAVVGFSMGGWVAAEIAVSTTARMSKLVLVDAVGIKVGGREERDVADIFGMSAADAAKLMWHDPSKAPNPMEMPDEALAMMAANRTALAAYTWQPFMHNPRLRHWLYRIDVPTLVLWGESDGVVKPAYGQAYAKLIPGARFDVIKGAGHAPQVEQPAAFADKLATFLS
ncbi:MAG: alpha/beta fold hydrolase [Rhodospirillales bacterium]